MITLSILKHERKKISLIKGSWWQCMYAEQLDKVENDHWSNTELGSNKIFYGNEDGVQKKGTVRNNEGRLI